MSVERTATDWIHDARGALSPIGRFGGRPSLFLLLTVLFALGARANDLVLVGATVYPDPDAPAIKDAVVILHDGRIAAVGRRTR